MQSGPTSTGLKRNLKKIARILRVKPLYQQERSAVFGERWAAIEKQLGPNDRSLLDVGCNMGNFTAKAASRGMFAIGVDPMEEAISRAKSLHARMKGCCFAWLDINTDTVKTLPHCDVALCLSVHHYWSRAHGEDGAWQIIAEILNRSGKLLFEPASSYVRYGTERPDFIENDEVSIDHYVRRRFAAIAPACKVTRLISTASINLETFRSMYLVER
ncbi:MAG: class I SAM-dependent methyltransferase [Hyphomicrobiales bacterium]